MFEGKNRRRYLLSFLLAISLLPFHFSIFSDPLVVSSQALPTESIDGSVTWSENRTVNGIVIVPSDATLTIAKGVTIEFDGKSTLQVEGKLVIDGTVGQPVVLKKKDADATDTYAISALFSGSIVARNADISGGGGIVEAFIIGETSRPRSLFNRARADWFYSGALSSVNGGRLDIEAVSFHDNTLAVYASNDSSRKVKVWRSKFDRNTLDFVNGNTTLKSDLRYNWWGNASGPEVCTVDCDYPRRTLEKIIGGADTSLFSVTDRLRNPVIIIPGILGSWRIFDDTPLVIDPIFDTFDPLIQTLDQNGYQEGKDLFVFPYEWRESNVETAKLLRIRIEEIKVQTKWPRVDIVSHSMGGLVARQYIEMLGGSESVNQLITLGTPQNGSPKSYLTWEGGEFTQDNFIEEFLIQKIFQQEAEENGYEGIFDYITEKPIESVRQLLPVYSYLRSVKTGDMREYPTGHPKNVFLEDLNDPDNLSNLDPVWFTNIVGKLKKDTTITGLRVSNSITNVFLGKELDILWGHGKPDGYDDLFGDQGLEIGSGDGTVPLVSSTGIVADETIELQSKHNDLPADAAKIVYDRLTGLDAVVTVPRMLPIDSMMIVQVYSPIDIQIVSPSGQRMGKNFVTDGNYDEIPGAFYTGFETENEFITIPNPEDGEYRIVTEGTGVGDYRIEATKIVEKTDALGVTESTTVIHGTAEVGKQEEKKVMLKDDVVTSEDEDTDAIAPTTEVSLSGTQGSHDWYTSDVTITLTATDDTDGSGVEKTEYSLDHGVTWNVSDTAIVLSQEGSSVIRYFSTDKAGNKEMIRTQEMKIDKTAPEAKMIFNTSTQKLDILGIDSLGGSVNVVTKESVMEGKGEKGSERMSGIIHWKWWKRWEKGRTILTTMLTDPAGHVTVLVFEKRKDRQNRIDLALQSIAYDGSMKNFANSGIQYKWQKDWRNKYFLFASHLFTQDMSVESHFLPKRNETWLMEKPRELADDGDDERERRPLRKKIPGMVVPHLTTLRGTLQIGY